MAQAQLEACPYGYYLATNDMCYPYSQQQLQQLQQQMPVASAATTNNSVQTPTVNYTASTPDHILTKYASTPGDFANGNMSSVQIAFVTVKKISLGSSGNQYQMQGTIRNTSGQDFSWLDINAMLIDAEGHNVGMVWGIPSSFHLANQQSTSFSGVLNEDSQNAAATAYKMTVGWTD